MVIKRDCRSCCGGQFAVETLRMTSQSNWELGKPTEDAPTGSAPHPELAC